MPGDVNFQMNQRHEHMITYTMPVFSGERLCIEGCGAPAMQAWVHTLHRAQGE